MSERKPNSARDLAEVMAEFAAAMRPAIEQINKNMESIRRTLVDAGIVPPPLPEDPRERALCLRKHRNTGPGKPIQEQRRRR